MGGIGGVDQRMEYDKMEEAAAAYVQVAGQLHDLHQAMKQISEKIEGGGLLGDAGDEFRDAINSVLVNKIMRIERKCRELDKDLRGAVSKIRDGVATAESRFA